MPTTLDWLNNYVLEDWRSISRYPPKACTAALDHPAQISCPPAYDQWYLDGHFPLIVQQHGVVTAGRGKTQAEVHRINQMVWHLNTLPSGIPSLKDIKSDGWTCPCITGGAGRKMSMPMVH